MNLITKKAADIASSVVILLVALYGSIPLFTPSPFPPGYDAVMHLSKIRIFSGYFPKIPAWFPWWYCGTPSLRFYPPLSYYATTLVGWLLHMPAREAYGLIDLSSYFLAGFFSYLFMRALGRGHLASISTAVFYMLSPQTLYGRLFIGQFTHDFAMFLVPLSLFCVVQYDESTYKATLVTAPIFAAVFLSHLQTALCLGLMLAVYVLFKVAASVLGGKRELASVYGVVLGGISGLLLASFWLLPAFMEGIGNLNPTVETALKAMIPIESLFVVADQLWYLSPLQRIWCKQYFLGLPIIALSLLACLLLIRKSLDSKARFWALTSATWSALFLFAIVSPRLGLVIGWPNRFPYFVSMPMAVLTGFAVSWMERCLSSPSKERHSLRYLTRKSILALVVLSALVHAYDLRQFPYNPYVNEAQVSEWLDGNTRSVERVASFGTISYVFNVVSNGWQLDGGYVQGQINPDFYYRYFKTFTESNDIDQILEALNGTNTRYVVIPPNMAVPSTYRDRKFFDIVEMAGFTIAKLKDNYTLDFIVVTNGTASFDYNYSYPDELHLTVQSYSENVSLLVKMNYYAGWTANSQGGGVELVENHEGLMEMEASGAKSFDITLRYGQTDIDRAAMGVTIAGAAAYIIALLRRALRGF